MGVTVISTYSPGNYADYAKHFVSTLKRYVDPSVKVVLYTDQPQDFRKQNWHNLILNDCCPDLVEFKERNGHRPLKPGKRGFIKDAVRFSHKSYAICHAAMNCTTKQLVWLDADTVCLSPLSTRFFKRQLPNDAFCSYLGREPKYTETGYLHFDMTNKFAKEFFEMWKMYYDTDAIYNLRGHLDCHVFDIVRKQFEVNGDIIGHNLAEGVDKSHFNKVFRGKMRHNKGESKITWKSIA